MESASNLPGFRAIVYALAYMVCLYVLLPGTVRKPVLKLGIVFCLILPYILFFLKPNLLSHELLAIGLILISAMIFQIRFFFCCYMTVISYLTVTFAMLCAHVLAFAFIVPVDLMCVLTYPATWDISLLHLFLTGVLMLAYQGFIRFFKGSRQKTKVDAGMLILMNGGILAGLLMASNIYLRFLALYSLELVRIPRLMVILICGFVAMVLLTGLFVYLLSLTVVSRLHLHEVKEYAERDIQTGVLNRQAGLDALALRIQESKVKNKALTICFVDINNLKQVNDKLGHKAGDQLIEVVSEAIRSSLRNNDFVCRLGGDEFLITYCDCGLAPAKAAWNRIYTTLMKKNENPEIGFPVSVSYGFSEYNTIESLNVMDFIEQADAAMYAHKSKYKNLKKSTSSEAVPME